ncbi:carbohydrate ABC transporter permease [Salinispira pacifica]
MNTTLAIRRPIGTLLRHAIVIIVALVFFSPFVYLFSTALKSSRQLLTIPRAFFPAPLHFENFITIFQKYAVGTYFLNTFLVVVFSIVGNVIVTTLTAYALARMWFRGRELLFTLTLSCMFMPLFLIIIPRFLIFKQLGMIGTLLPLIVPSALGSPFCIFLMRQYLRSIPMELSEAAYIDGCSELRIYAQIIMPLSRPAIATVIIFTTQWRWNDFIEPLIYLQNQKLYTITMGLYTILGTSAEEINIHLVMTFLIISVLPIIAIFLLAQKQFVAGMAHTGLKG